MTKASITGLLWFSAIGCGLMAGVYFAFSGFIMTALSRIDQASGVAAMNSINTVILRSLFMPIFFGTTLTGLILAAAALFRWGTPGAFSMLVGGVVYVVGMFVVTMLFNVPLEQRVASRRPGERGSGDDLGALSARLDDVEPRADCCFHGGLRVIHRRADRPIGVRKGLAEREGFEPSKDFWSLHP